MSTVISVEHISKAYRLGSIGGASLQDDLARWWARARRMPDPLLKIGQEHRARRMGEQFWALDDVSFAVKEGEVLGVIGRNGAGKSTLLKILSQVTAPTSGLIKLRGRVASLLEVGTGFHPELTGRENIVLNGAILGMTKTEIRDKFDDIVAFSECEAFIDTPVKRYSSGMFVRLAFAVAAHLEPEILIVDEVLSVGDADFQKKCLGKMGDVARDGRTILFVSHNIGAIVSLCSRCLLIENGLLAKDGDPADVAAAYQTALCSQAQHSCDLADAEHYGTGKARFTALKVTPLSIDGTRHEYLRPGDSLKVDVAVAASDHVTNANACVVLYDSAGYRLIDVNTALKGRFVNLSPGQKVLITFDLHNVLLKPGTYLLGLWLGRGGIEDIDGILYATSIVVEPDPAALKHAEIFPGVYQCEYDMSSAPS